ncbi:hypothetical protein BX616_007925 [Lobosporangium transversale]|nr:hypothetical protein BX616_007925 [Lobosporangium transversale]
MTATTCDTDNMVANDFTGKLTVIGRNVNLTNSHRKQICEMRAANPEMTLDSLATWAQQHFSLARKPAMGTLSRIINKQSRYRNMTESELQSQRKRAVLCEELDLALVSWVKENQDRNFHISYKMIIQKGKELAALIKTLPAFREIEMPSFSNGWVSGFTKRHMFMGDALKPKGISATAASTLEDLANGTIIGFSTDQELIERGIAEARFRANKELDEDTDQQMELRPDLDNNSNAETTHSRSSGSGYSHDYDDSDVVMADDSMAVSMAITTAPSMEDLQISALQADLSQQVVHAVKSNAAPTATAISENPLTSTISASTSAPAKKRRSRAKQRQSQTETQPQPDIKFTSNQHQHHPAAPGLIQTRTRPVDAQTQSSTTQISSTTSSTSLLPLVRTAGTVGTPAAAETPGIIARDGSASASPSALLSNADSARGLPSAIPPLVRSSLASATTKQTLNALRILLKNLDRTIDYEANLIPPLAELHMKYQDKLEQEERRQQGSMNTWRLQT